MAERRMFSKKITESDAFLDMPSSTQALYFHLNMAADDDGFVNNPRKIQRMVGSSDDDMKLLIAKSFIITFDSGIIVIKHWKMHNYIQNDRYKPTDYVDEKSMLELKKNKAYTINVSNADTKCVQDVSVGKDRLGKDRLGKVRLGKDRIYKDSKEIKNNTSTYVPDELLNQTILKFIEMRKKIKAPMTDYAIDLMIKKLEKMASDNDTKIQILNQSIESSWKGIFPLKENSRKQSTTDFYNDMRRWAEEYDNAGVCNDSNGN